MEQEIFAKLPGVLLPWYEENRRDLPWRSDKEPYHIWLSEIMLQQTRVEAVKGYYSRFLKALPTIDDLSNAPEEQLYKLWEGLGYYSRVRNLQKAAKVIMDKYDGVFPQAYSDVIVLPGIGAYTAGAILSIAFEKKIPAVDGNVLRVAARLTDAHTPVDTPAYKQGVFASLQQIYPPQAGAFTQALMELGATVCGPNRKPDCSNCPCKAFCLGYLRNTADTLPVRLPKKERKTEKITVLLLSCEGTYALQKRPNSGLLAGLWQFPNIPCHLNTEEAVAAVEAMGMHLREIYRISEKNHIFTHILWQMQGIYMEVDRKSNSFCWLTPEEIAAEAALPTAFRQFLEGI